MPTGEIGFPSLRTRILNVTDSTVLSKACRELGRRLRDPATITVGGSLALMAEALLSRATDGVDVVDELPPDTADDGRQNWYALTGEESLPG